MADEIERRFILIEAPDFADAQALPVSQGYLSTDPAKTIRIRRIGDEGKITVKGLNIGGKAPEFEYAIPVEDAESMMGLCNANDMIRKDRYAIPSAEGFTWEVDFFKDKLHGLVIAEIELPAIDTPVALPAWLEDNAIEITGDNRFANAALTKMTYADTCRIVESDYGVSLPRIQEQGPSPT